MSSNYNRIPRPAAVLVHDGHSELVQKRNSRMICCATTSSLNASGQYVDGSDCKP